MVSMPRRRGERRDSVSLPVAIFSGTFDAPVEVESVDLSPSGMFLLSDLLLSPGERVLVAFVVPGTLYRVLIDARVVRTAHDADGAGMGLEFSRLPSVDEKILRAALDRRLAAIRAFRADGAFRC